ncbi:insulinase family protein [Aquibacillus sp. 3ASR75-11]|uniref:Insulinase family protein n=1 Tax=Terrihalobacillus insolitus TaxID=2950438 RepID=A0A9X4AMH4_9BACI|nr:pitrilysin family protein [Terrihalobacillus insolitus]MDC3414077.1 insulinase family protein [Terrihalobacillus insolitus]MDC3423518.1 insulinase family protein [Terrihalobacillus insolitus]
MKSTEEEIVQKNGYNIHFLTSEKYKTINIVVKLKAPLTRETITMRALLPYILQQGTKNHPNARALRIALDDLFGATLSIDGSKKGEEHILSLRLEFANETYLTTKEDIFDRAVTLLSEIIFEPKSKDGMFDETIVKREKQTLKAKIDSIIDDKMAYANMRLIDEMCKDEPYRLHVHGYLEDLDTITPDSLFEYYQQLLKEDQMDVYVLGDFDASYVKGLVNKHFKEREESIDHNDRNAKDVHKKREVQNIVEKQSIQQAKLHLGYRTNITYGDDDYYALQVFNGIFGGFPSSKLFINVREKNSLAYYAASRIESHKGLLLVFSGIAPTDFDKANDIIQEQMEQMRQGNFTEEQVKETKNLVVNQLLETMDNPQGLIEILYHQVLAKSKITPEQVMERIKNVTKADLMNVATKIELDTVYFLTNEGEI